MRRASGPPTPRPVRTRSRAWLWPDESRQPDGAAVDQGDPEAPAVDAEDGVGGGHPEVAPQGQLEAAGHGVALDGGDDGLGQLEAGGAHGPGPVLEDGAAVALVRERLRSAPAQKEPPAPVRMATEADVVVVEGGGKRSGRAAAVARVDGVAPLGPADGDDGHGAVGGRRRRSSRGILPRADPSGRAGASTAHTTLAAPEPAAPHWPRPKGDPPVDNCGAARYSRAGDAEPAADRLGPHRLRTNTTAGGEMAVRLGDIAPDFTADTTEGTINFHEWLGDSWGILFSHPKDFTPVCTTELGAFAKAKAEFDKRNTKLIGLSVDSVESHNGWDKDIEETQGQALNFPVIGDPDRKVADLYDMIHPNANDTLTVRSVFIIGPDKKVKLDHHLPGVHRPQRRRGAAGARLAPAHRRLPGGHPGQLEGRRGRHHRPGRLRRGRQGEVPQGLEGPQALPAGDPAAQQVSPTA